MMSHVKQVSLNDLTPHKKIPQKYPDLFTERSWHWKVQQRKNNGLAKAFRKVGKDLYVNEVVLAECIDAQLADK
ncbi:MAG: hypothetical protein HOK65_12120 [Crocinitomicaceae bacterium]|jgi:hypothetical protein|nr:hypothetical protein [Crocinitomicaceae bacterium]